MPVLARRVTARLPKQRVPLRFKPCENTHAPPAIYFRICRLGKQQQAASATDQAAAAKTVAVATGKLPLADLSDEQLQARWNQLATAMSLEKMKLHDCQPAAAPAGQRIFSCHSAPRSMVYIVRVNGQVTRIQFTSLLGFFSVSLAEASNFMARFLHEGNSGDDVTLVAQFLQEASRSKRFCVPSPATQSQMCYLTDGRSYGVEIR